MGVEMTRESRSGKQGNTGKDEEGDDEAGTVDAEPAADAVAAAFAS